MRKVNIQTPQNVVIENTLASASIRAFASLFDLFILGVYFLICILIVSSITSYTEEADTIFVAFWMLYMPVFLFYSPLCEMLFKGQSLGKLIIGIRVVSTNGENINAEQAIMRWVFRIIDLWASFGAFGIIFCSASEKGQRLGDTLGETLLIKTKENTYNIHDILKIKTKEKKEFNPSYPGVVRYTDEDMLWLKRALNRRKQNKSEPNRKLLIEAARKIQEDLGLENVPKNKITFLNQILEEYIVLTRS